LPQDKLLFEASKVFLEHPASDDIPEIGEGAITQNRTELRVAARLKLLSLHHTIASVLMQIVENES